MEPTALQKANMHFDVCSKVLIEIETNLHALPPQEQEQVLAIVHTFVGLIDASPRVGIDALLYVMAVLKMEAAAAELNSLVMATAEALLEKEGVTLN
jgi:hypothetical protein